MCVCVCVCVLRLSLISLVSTIYDMSLCVRKPTIWIPTRSDTNCSVTEDGLRLEMLSLESRGIILSILCSENKVTVKLICAFVFAHADCWFSPCSDSYKFQRFDYLFHWFQLFIILST